MSKMCGQLSLSKLIGVHTRKVDTHRSLFGNVLDLRIQFCVKTIKKYSMHQSSSRNQQYSVNNLLSLYVRSAFAAISEVVFIEVTMM